MKKHGDVLRECDLQFAFKEGHSTVIAMLKGTISHYMECNIEVYVCLLDASKAFDRDEYPCLNYQNDSGCL